MKKLRRKRMLLQGVSAVCNMGGTWMVVVTVCQIVQSAERETVGGFVVGMLAALAYGLCALLLWSYGLDLAAAARRITRKVARMQAEEMYAAINPHGKRHCESFSASEKRGTQATAGHGDCRLPQRGHKAAKPTRRLHLCMGTRRMQGKTMHKP